MAVDIILRAKSLASAAKVRNVNRTLVTSQWVKKKPPEQELDQKIAKVKFFKRNSMYRSSRARERKGNCACPNARDKVSNKHLL